MNFQEQDGSYATGIQPPLLIQTNNNFQLEVLEKLGRVEAKVDMIVGDGQPGRMRLAEDRITVLERNDIRRNLLDRMVTAGIAFAVSALIALHDHLLPSKKTNESFCTTLVDRAGEQYWENYERTHLLRTPCLYSCRNYWRGSVYAGLYCRTSHGLCVGECGGSVFTCDPSVDFRGKGEILTRRECSLHC